jgi:hypothetical protein
VTDKRLSVKVAPPPPSEGVERRRSQHILKLLAVASVVVGAVTALLLGGPRAPARQATVLEVSRVDPPVPPKIEAPERGGMSPSDSPDAVPAREQIGLAEMSETFRNTTFLIAIRDAGFVCEDVVAAHESDADIWVASCRDIGSGFEIDAGDPEKLVVRPAARYIDALDLSQPLLDDRFRVDRDAPLRLPAPQGPR